MWTCCYLLSITLAWSHFSLLDISRHFEWKKQMCRWENCDYDNILSNRWHYIHESLRRGTTAVYGLNLSKSWQHFQIQNPETTVYSDRPSIPYHPMGMHLSTKSIFSALYKWFNFDMHWRIDCFLGINKIYLWLINGGMR